MTELDLTEPGPHPTVCVRFAFPFPSGPEPAVGRDTEPRFRSRRTSPDRIVPLPIEAERRVLTQFATVFVFLALALAFLVVSMVVSFLLRPKAPHEAKQMAYECGEEPEGSPWVQFNLRFYLIALFFIVFDVELIFLLPWAVAFNEMLAELGAFAFWEMVFFIAILVLGLAYVWAKGDLDWVKGLTRRSPEELSPLSRYSSGGDAAEPWTVKAREVDHDAA